MNIHFVILRVLTILFIGFTAKAQDSSFKNKTKVSGEKKVYNIKKTKSNHLIVTSENSDINFKYDPEQSELIEASISEIRNDKELINKIVLKVFGKERLKALADSESIFVIAKIKNDGTVLGTSFVIDENSAITPLEIERLESALKAEYKPKFRKRGLINTIPELGINIPIEIKEIKDALRLQE